MAKPDPAALKERLQKWADGRSTLKDVRGYSDEELYAIARMAYFFFYQGKIDQARSLFQGLYAVNPLDTYFAKALGVVEMAAGNPQGAMAAYDVALKIAPDDPAAYVGRSEVRLAQGERRQAIDDLRRADMYCKVGDPLKSKISALLQSLTRKPSSP